MKNAQQTIAKPGTDRRDDERREGTHEALLPALETFCTTERRTLQRLDRRRTIRRDCDVQRRLNEV